MKPAYEDSWTKVYIGDSLELMKALPPQSVHCCVTSPPYWSLRSYLSSEHPDKHMELGNEPTPECYVERLVEIFRALRRVLRDDGQLWLNLSTTFASRSMESEEWVLREDLSPEEIHYVLSELAAVQGRIANAND